MLMYTPNSLLKVYLDVYGSQRCSQRSQLPNWVRLIVLWLLSPKEYSRWEAGAYTAVSFTVPDNWKAGRIWVLLLPTSSTPKLYHLYHNDRAGVTATSVPTLVRIPVWMVGVTEVFSVILIREL